MRYIHFLLLFFCFQHTIGQVNENFNFLLVEVEEDKMISCDTIITIASYGNIKSKLIYKQNFSDNWNKNRIEMPYSKVCKNDPSIIFSDVPRSTKTILKIDYDTCYLMDSKKKDSKSEYINFDTPPLINRLNGWTIKIDYLDNHCMDTDYHFVRVSKNAYDYIDFTCTHNVQVFEHDLNDDNLNEIYLISYVWCSSEIEIYRIDICN